MKPTLGDIAVSGKLSALIEVGAGFHPDLTGRENIFLNGTILGMKRDEIKRKFDEIVEFSGLAEFIDTPVKRYSSGMYARLGFSVAAHVDPEILIVDEVLSVGDWAFQTKCMQKMTSVISAGATIIFVSHNLKAVVSLCKRSALLERGRIAELGLTNQVISRYIKATAISQERPLENEIRIRHIAMRDNRGGNLQFEPGQKVWVDISMSSTVNCRNLSVVLGIRDDNYYQVFNTASERLGYEPISMEAGELRVITFELTLHLAPGIYHLGLALKRYDINRLYDERSPALTFFVNSDDQDIRGVVNLYPKIVEDEVTNGFKERSKETFVRSSH
jgi:lipopolysaccharide transport system ATP-binding protein